MSENTKKLDLFKYDTETDGKQTFNLNIGLNDNWDKLENKISVSEYSATAEYPQGYWVRGELNGERKLFESLVEQNIGRELSDATAWKELSFGGGLEIGDIGIAPLGIDESKGKRRYLNGQYIMQDSYKAFAEKVKNVIAKYPSLVCTESEWQTISAMSVGGQCGKFVVDDVARTIRLPKIIMPIQGLTDLSKLGEIVEAGLPTHTHTTNLGRAETQDGTGYFVLGAGGTPTTGTYGSSTPNNPIYGKSSTVQQEQIQYPYFIQVATGAETKDEIINEHELVNPYVLLEPKFFETPIYNLSWLATGGFNGSKVVHPSAYDALLIELNEEIEVGTTQNNYTKRGLAVKLATESFSDYDFVVDTANETFRCPLKVKVASGDDSLLYFYIGEVAQNTNLINAGRIEEQLSILNQSSRSFLVEKYENGASWYRVYSDGWCEQGSSSGVTAQLTNIALLKPYKNTAYTCVGIQSNINNAGYHTINVGIINNSTIQLRSTPTGSPSISWIAFGYIY